MDMTSKIKDFQRVIDRQEGLKRADPIYPLPGKTQTTDVSTCCLVGDAEYSIPDHEWDALTYTGASGMTHGTDVEGGDGR
jgi:hypothetical protein